MNKDLRYITNMIDFGSRALETFSKAGNDVDKLENDYDLYNSVLMSLVQIGENANLVSEVLKEKTEYLNWRKHIKNRNFYVHVYGAINNRRWNDYLQREVPQLLDSLSQLKANLNKKQNDYLWFDYQG